MQEAYTPNDTDIEEEVEGGKFQDFQETDRVEVLRHCKFCTGEFGTVKETSASNQQIRVILDSVPNKLFWYYPAELRIIDNG